MEQQPPTSQSPPEPAPASSSISAATSASSSTPQPPEQQQTPPVSLTPPAPPQTAVDATTTIPSAVSPTPPPPSIPSSISSSTATTPVAEPVSAPPSPSIASRPTLNPNPSTSTTQPSQFTSQTKLPFNHRPWQQQPPSPFSHYSLPAPPLPLPPQSVSSNPAAAASASSTLSISVPPPPRGGMAIGVPARPHGTPPPPPTSFSSLNPPSFGQPFGALGRSVTDSGPSLTSSQNFQGHGMLRVSSVGSPGSPSPSSSHNPQPQNQPWLSSGSQGRPPLPPTSLRPHLSSPSMQQRSNIPQQHHHSVLAPLQQQQSSSQQSQQPPPSGQSQEHHGQQFPQSRIQQSLPNQQQRGQNSGIQRPPLSMMQSGAVQLGVANRIGGSEVEKSCTRILSKRSIQEIVSQIDPSEKLDPEVEDILVDIAEDFVESITTFGCSLAKHRKSTTLEAKDILLHLERNWNMTLPGFGGDEIKTYRKPLSSDIHKERLAVIKKSILATEVTNPKTSTGQAGGSAKVHFAKGPTNILGSPTTKGH